MSSLKKSIAYQSVYQILLILLPFITAPYIARVLGKENSGIYSYCNTIAVYFVVFANLGIEQYGNRCIARVRDDQKETSRVFFELLIYHLIVSAISIAAYIIYAFCISNNYKTIVLIEGIYAISVFFDISWFFFGIEQFRAVVIRNSIIKIISVILIFLLVKSHEDLPVYTAIMAGSILLSQISLWPLLRKHISFQRIRFSDLNRHTIPMLLLFIAVIAANMNRVIDKAMLGWFGYIEDLGCYDYADRIIRMPLGLIAALGTVMLSKMSNLYARKEDHRVNKILDFSAYIVLIFSFAFGFGLAAISPEFIQAYLGLEYTETSILVLILATSIPIVGWNNFIRTQILIPTRNDKIYTCAVLAGAIVNIIINVFLIRFFSARGAAVATIISYAVICAWQTRYAMKNLDMRNIIRIIPVIILTGAVMYLAVRLVAVINLHPILTLLFEIVTGIVVYGGIITIYLRLRKPEILKLLLKRKTS